MARVLMVGVDPAEVDFSDPSLPPGMNADMVRRGIEVGLDGLRAAGHDPRQMFIPADPDRLQNLAERLAGDPFDCVIVGGGICLPPRNRTLFEAVLNVIARTAPAPAIALVARPDDAAAAVARVVG